jgi:hypothetical protein
LLFVGNFDKRPIRELQQAVQVDLPGIHLLIEWPHAENSFQDELAVGKHHAEPFILSSLLS